MAADDNSDEEDYMSTEFLTKFETSGPGLLNSKKLKRDHELAKKKVYCQVVQKKGALEALNREEKLNKPLDAENLGFKLLTKMGYKSEEGIGNKNKVNIGPIPITLKNDKKGLGTTQTKLILQKRLEVKVANHEILINHYVKSNREKVNTKHMEISLLKARKVCANLDSEYKEKSPNHNNSPSFLATDSLYANIDPISTDLIGNKRKQYDDSDDDNINENDYDSDIANDEEEEQSYESMQNELKDLCLYMREHYTYCFWCAVKYQDQKDMDENCPGLTEDEH